MTDEIRLERDSDPGMICGEAGGDYTLPDYLAEVRRVLRADCSPVPAGQYASGGQTSAGGEAVFHLLYTDPDGNLAAAPLTGSYEVTFPSGDGVSLMAEPEAEGITCRPQSARKVTLKTGICMHPTVVETEVLPAEPHPEGAGEIACLRTNIHTAQTTPFSSSDIRVSESVKAEAGAVPLTVTGNLLVRECRPERGGVRVRGDVWLSALCRGADGMPQSLRTKIPLEEFIPADGVTPDDSAVAWGSCRNLSLTSSGDAGISMTFDTLVDIWGIAVSSGEASPVTDMYATGCALHVTTRPVTSRWYPAAVCANFSVDGGEDYRCDGEVRVVDAAGTAKATDCRAEGNDAVLDGEIRVSCILHSDENGYTPESFPVPFRVRIPLRQPLDASAKMRVTVRCLAADCRAIAGRITADCEIAVTLVATQTDTCEAVVAAEAQQDDTVSHPAGEMIAVYLRDGDTLWGIGKRYHVPLSQLIRDNNLPQDAAERPDDPEMLDGMTRLMIAE